MNDFREKKKEFKRNKTNLIRLRINENLYIRKKDTFIYIPQRIKFPPCYQIIIGQSIIQYIFTIQFISPNQKIHTIELPLNTSIHLWIYL